MGGRAARREQRSDARARDEPEQLAVRLAAPRGGAAAVLLEPRRHGDRIRLPSEATLLGSSLHCKEQVFRVKRHAIGLQCHLEVSGSSLENWIRADRSYVVNAMGADGPEQLQNDWKRQSFSLSRSGRMLFSNALTQLMAEL